MHSAKSTAIQLWFSEIKFHNLVFFLSILVVAVTVYIFCATPVEAQTRLPPGSACTAPAQCASGVCTGGSCQASTGGTPASADNWTPFKQTKQQTGNFIDAASFCFLLDGPGGAMPGEGCPERDRATNQLFVYNKLPSGGAIGTVGKIMTAMYVSPPSSSTEYLADLGTNLGIVQPAYAQNVVGSGDGVIRPVLRVWQVARNISYLGFILVFLAVGFMIMFRQKLNPQTVVTIQSALPGLVIGLVLVTFSYLIAAFIVDICFISMQLVAYLFNSATTVGDRHLSIVSNAVQMSREANVFNLWGTFAFNRDNWGLIKDGIQQSFLRILPADSLGGITNGNPLWRGALEGLGFGIGGIFTFVILLALFIQMLRLLWQLVLSYITIVVMTVLGPFLILIGSIPGRGGTISFWWKSILGNVLVFPAVFAAFLFAAIFLGQTDPGAFGTTLPLFAGIPVNLLRVIIAFGIILGTPAIPKVVKGLLGVKDIGDIGAQGMAGFAAGAGAVRAGAVLGAERATPGLKYQREAFQKANAAYKIGQSTDNPYDQLGSKVKRNWLSRTIVTGNPFTKS